MVLLIKVHFYDKLKKYLEPLLQPTESTLAKLLNFPGLSVTALTSDGKRSPLKQFLSKKQFNINEKHTIAKTKLSSNGIFI